MLHLPTVRRLAAIGFLLAACLRLAGADGTRRHYDIPAGPAAETLREFGAAAQVHVLYSEDAVQGVSTSELHGDFTARDGLAALLQGTPLTAVPDEESGGFTVVRRSAAPDQAGRAKREADGPFSDEVVHMEAFQVSTAIGNYAESTASTGTKMPMETLRIPYTVQVLNASFLNDRNAQSLDDVYNYVLGMARVSGGATDFTLRGFSSHGAGLNLHNLEVDGLPGLTTRFGSPNTANIERVEVLKGPASMLYGLSTPGGMINLVTKQPQPKFNAEVTGVVSGYAGFVGNFGSNLSYTGTVDVTGPIDPGGRVLYRLIARADDLSSFRDNNFNQNQYLYPSVTWVIDPTTSLTIEGEVLRQKRLADYLGLVVPFANLSNLPAYNTNYNNPTDIERDIGDAVTAMFRHTLANGWVLHVGARSANNTNSRKLLDYSSLKTATPVQNTTLVRTFRDFSGNNNRVNFIDANLYGDVGPAWCVNRVLVGASYDVDLVGQTRIGQGPTVPGIPIYVTAVPGGYPPDGSGQNKPRSEYYSYSGYVSDHIKLGEHWEPSVGVRYDHQDGYNEDLIAHTKQSKKTGAAVPNAGLLYLVTDWLSAYASYSASFFPNSLTAYDASNRQGFDPQTASQWEVGAKASPLGGNLNLTVSLYDIRMKNVLEATPFFTPQGNPISQLDGQQESKGVEAEMSWLPRANWQITAGISYLDARVTQSDTPALVNTPLPNAPHTTANFWTRYNLPTGVFKGLGVGAGVTYEGRYPTSIAGLVIPGHTLVDAAVYYAWARYKVALNVANALDAKYILSQSQDLAGVWPGSPRQLTLTFNVKL